MTNQSQQVLKIKLNIGSIFMVYSFRDLYIIYSPQMITSQVYGRVRLLFFVDIHKNISLFVSKIKDTLFIIVRLSL